MTRDEANKLAAQFKGLMPRMTEEQVRLIRDELISVPEAAAARKRIVAYCCSRAEFDLMSALNAVRARCDFARQTKSRMDEYREYEEAVLSQHAKEDAAIGALSADAQLLLVEQVMVLLPERIAEVERRRPELSRLVKGLMYQQLADQLASHPTEAEDQR